MDAVSVFPFHPIDEVRIKRNIKDLGLRLTGESLPEQFMWGAPWGSQRDPSKHNVDVVINRLVT